MGDKCVQRHTLEDGILNDLDQHKQSENLEPI